MEDFINLKGKLALIKAGTKGTGAATVKLFNELGATVLTTARTQPDYLPNNVHFVSADLTTREGCEAVVQAVKELLGGVD
ncbi:SDR family NAD(P)-dependent oxidoreductase, partial [Acinetobacter baumannii]|uniref:SDR family NAD(P)-dependent oxidoreductase n=1 Tax=Acinetobacter baumannii TaxID=470 RepID=UPI003AF59919